MAKRTLALVMVLFLLVSVAAFAEDVILIGGIAPLTGPVSVYGIAVQEAVDMYVEDINANGGVLGRQVKMLWLDDQHKATEAVTAYNRLIDTKGINAMLGPVTSTPVLAVVDMASEDGIPTVTPTGTADAITEAGYENVFRGCFKDSFQGTVMAAFVARSLNMKTAAVLYDNTSDYSSGIAENFVARSSDYDLEVVAYEACTAQSGDFKAQLTKIAASKAECVFIPMYYNDVALIIRQAQEIGITVPLLGVDGWDGLLDQFEDTSVLDGYYFCNHSAADDTSDNYVAFRDAYIARYGAAPNALACLGYDGIKIILDAIERAGSTDWDEIIEAIGETDYEGVSGHINYEGTGDPANKSAVIIEIRDGGFHFFDRILP